MHRITLLAIAFVILASMAGAVGQHLIKTGADRFSGPWPAYFLSPWVLGGMGSYLSVMVLMSLAFRAGGTVTVLYPIYALTYVWAALIGARLSGQPVAPLQVAGMALLIAGMALIGVGGHGR